MALSGNQLTGLALCGIPMRRRGLSIIEEIVIWTRSLFRTVYVSIENRLIKV